MESIYELCFYGGLALAVIFLILSIVLFIVLKIPKVIGDLTGRSAKKDIKERQQVTPKKESVAKKEQAKYYNQGAGKIKVRETVSEKTRKANRDNTTDSLRKAPDIEETEVLNAANRIMEAEETEVLSGGNISDDEATDVLVTGDDDVTDVLKAEDDEATDVLKAAGDDEATDVLKSGDDEATDVLKAAGDDEATDVLKSGDDDVTDVLKTEVDDVTDVLSTADDEATDVLRGDDDGDSTTVLSSGNTRRRITKAKKVIYNVVVTHTDEEI